MQFNFNTMDYVPILSPAKSLHENVRQASESSPVFMRKAKTINNIIRKMSVNELMNLQGISRSLAELNEQRNNNWFEERHVKGSPALFTFSGDVYQGLEPETLSEKALERARSGLLILSGLYGVLRPFDAMLPYRLEMGTKLPVGKAPNLHTYWRRDVTRFINEYFDQRTLVNLASKEYSAAISRKGLNILVLNVEFKDFSNGEYKVISFYAKKARGYYARFLLEYAPSTIRELQSFNTGGYAWSQEHSTDRKMVFLRGK